MGRRYKERRKKRIQENNNTPSESDSSIHDKDKNSNTDIVSESLDVKSIMSQWKGSQISTREPVHQRPNRIESRINEEIRLAAEKEAEYRREKGVQHEYNIKPESYDKELKEAQQKLEKIQQKEQRRSSQSRLSQSRLSNSDQEELTTGE